MAETLPATERPLLAALQSPDFGKVTVLRLLMRHTVEEKMMLLKSLQERLYKALLEGAASLTREDFESQVGDGEKGRGKVTLPLPLHQRPGIL